MPSSLLAAADRRCELTTPTRTLPSRAQVLENAFAVFDADKSGSLSATELKDILTREGNNALSEADAQEIISTVDANGDGQLNISEFIQLMKSRADI